MRLIDADSLYDFLTGQLDKETGMYSKVRNGGINIARSALHDKTITPTIAPPPNDPLTLDKLREMDGEPVWNDTMKQWAIVDTHDRRAINVCGRWRPLSDCYYRRKPGEESGTSAGSAAPEWGRHYQSRFLRTE